MPLWKSIYYELEEREVGESPLCTTKTQEAYKKAFEAFVGKKSGDSGCMTDTQRKNCDLLDDAVIIQSEVSFKAGFYAAVNLFVNLLMNVNERDKN